MAVGFNVKQCGVVAVGVRRFGGKKGPETLGFRPFTGHDFRLEGTGDHLSPDRERVDHQAEASLLLMASMLYTTSMSTGMPSTKVVPTFGSDHVAEWVDAPADQHELAKDVVGLLHSWS